MLPFTKAPFLRAPYDLPSGAPAHKERSNSLHTYEVAAMRKDGSRSIASFRAPSLPLFESAFSAFTRGVVIAGPTGGVAVEDLRPGDWVNTSSGSPAQVLWIGASTFAQTERGKRTPLIRIMADSLGPNRPESFLTLGPGARLLQTPPHLRGAAAGSMVLTPASTFVDNLNVIEVVPPTPVKLFHICLTRHAAVDIGGIEAETFHPGQSAFRNVTHAQRNLFLSMFPHIAHATDFGPFAHPRASEQEDAA